MRKPRTYRLTVPVKPKTKQRHRMGRGRHVYTPQATIDFEKLVKQAWIESGHPTLTQPCKVKIRLRKDCFYITVTELSANQLKATVTGDVDNYAKTILDGLQGDDGAFCNDRQVWELTVIKHQPAKAAK